VIITGLFVGSVEGAV
jgi:hypothetical protein